ncbi:hypothetical protein Tsubulata_036984, partial [Turnera subulata]
DSARSKTTSLLFCRNTYLLLLSINTSKHKTELRDRQTLTKHNKHKMVSYISTLLLLSVFLLLPLAFLIKLLISDGDLTLMSKKHVKPEQVEDKVNKTKPTFLFIPFPFFVHANLLL